MKMAIVTIIEYWPAKYFATEEEQACMEHELKLYGPVEMKEKELGIERLVVCSQWEGNNARTMAVLKIPPKLFDRYRWSDQVPLRWCRMSRKSKANHLAAANQASYLCWTVLTDQPKTGLVTVS